MTRPHRLAFVTIGESPRDDIVPEMLADIGGAVEAHEFGALDGLSDAAIAALTPRPGETAFATRRRDGREVTIAKERVEVLLEKVLAQVDDQNFDAVVLLCTGTHVKPLQNTLMIEAQRIVDSMVEAMAASSRRLGVMLPLERQIEEFPKRHVFPSAEAPRLVAASPYAGDAMAEKAAGLAGCDLVIMHCMGYSEDMRAEVRRVVDAPVLLSRRIVSGAIRQIL
ncbi:AroM family protein [Microvirga antarctica]|uniref:AroM family protein n=1 Tax=Microvirga antarctica TaxID=2819233 RepID=UPI001B318399|nr:AroM family protein [Microvirga antarctica]